MHFEGSGAAGGVEMHARKTSIAELENARDLHGETNIDIGLHRPAHLPFAAYGSYLASCGPHVMLDIFCIIDSQCLSLFFFFFWCNLSNVFLGNFVL